MANGHVLPGVSFAPLELTSWRVAAGVRVDRLCDELAELPAAAARSTAARTVADIGDILAEARDVIMTSQKAGPFAKAWDAVTGSKVEQAWQLLHLAEEELVAAQPEDALLQQRPYYCALAKKTYDDARSAATCGAIEAWAPGKVDRQLAHDILVDVHTASDMEHQQVRQFRNLLYLLTLICLAFAVVLWRLDLTTGRYLVLGAIGGAVSMVFAVKQGKPHSPYNLATPQLFLKIATGALTAALAIKILQSIGATKSADMQVWAIVFGFSQQAFTFLVDNRVATLKEKLG